MATEKKTATAKTANEDPTRAFSLSGRVAVVTGAASGIGREVALTFARAGAKVVIADVVAAGLEATASMVSETGQPVRAQPTDVSQRDQVDRLASVAIEAFGQIDVWANVAGVINYFPIVEAAEPDVRAIVDVNLLGVYWGIAAAGRAMAGRGGNIVNVASAGGEVPAPRLSVYGMTKAGVIHLTKTAAVELGPEGIRVNAVAPGFVETGMTAPYFLDADGHPDPIARTNIIASRSSGSPLGIIGETSDIALAMLYLVSDASKFVTGQTLRPNGGVFMG